MQLCHRFWNDKPVKKKRIDSQATETKGPEVCRLGEEPYKNNSDGNSIGFLMVSCSVFSSLSSLLVLRVATVCGLTAAIQKERISGLLHDMIKENRLVKNTQMYWDMNIVSGNENEAQILK